MLGSGVVPEVWMGVALQRLSSLTGTMVGATGLEPATPCLPKSGGLRTAQASTVTVSV